MKLTSKRQDGCLFEFPYVENCKPAESVLSESQQKIRKFAFGDLADGNVRKYVKHIVHEMI